jgi:hypothetical protein
MRFGASSLRKGTKLQAKARIKSWFRRRGDAWRLLARHPNFGLGTNLVRLEFPKGNHDRKDIEAAKRHWYLQQRALADARTFLRNFEKATPLMSAESINQHLGTMYQISSIAKQMGVFSIERWCWSVIHRAKSFKDWLLWRQNRFKEPIANSGTA